MIRRTGLPLLLNLLLTLLVGCGVPILGWLYFVISFALTGHLPD